MSHPQYYTKHTSGPKKPVNEARPLGTAAVKTGKKARRDAAKAAANTSTKKVVDTSSSIVVASSQVESVTQLTISSAEAQEQKKPMSDITLTKDTKPRKSSSVVYNGGGLRSGVRIAKSAFIDGTAPDSIVISSDYFAPPKQPKVKLTKEERAAARANAPKLTLAEKIAKREAALAKLKAKAAAEASM